MKKLILLALPLLFLIACSQEVTDKKADDAVTLSGKIENPKGERVTLKGANDFSESANLQEDGTFSMSFDIEKAGNYSFRHGGERTTLHLEPGNQLELFLDTEQFDETLVYKGNGAVENNYLAALYLKNESLFEASKALYSSSKVDFDKKVAKAYAELNNFLKQYQQEHPDMDATFVSTKKTDLKYEELARRLSYPKYYEHYTTEKPEIGKDYYAFLDKAELNNESLLESSNYKSFLRSYLDKYLAPTEIEKDKGLENASNGQTIAEFRAIGNHFKNEKIKNYLLKQSISAAIAYGSLDGIEDLIADFNAKSTQEEDKTAIAEQFAKWSNLTKGKAAPVFAYNNIKGEKVSLEDMKGKYVYVDVWATWCGPCKRELPHLEAIEEAYKDNDNIVFASVSIDENQEAWEKMVKEKEMKGVQLIADKAWDSKIAKDYLINGIPRFILIDKEGNIVDARAARPSTNEIKEQLKELIGEGEYQATSMNL